MTQADKNLEDMRNNPRDWRIEALISVAVKYGIEIRNHGGSHHVFSYPGVELVVTVPAHRPIKPIYVRQFVTLLEHAKGKKS